MCECSAPRSVSARHREAGQQQAQLESRQPPALVPPADQVSASMRQLRSGYGSEPRDFDRYIHDQTGTVPIPTSLNCWEAVVCAAIASGQLDRATLAEYELYDGTDAINTVLGLDAAQDVADTAAVPAGRVIFLFHTAHVVQALDNGRCLSWWGAGTRDYTLEQVITQLSQASDEVRWDAIQTLTNNSSDARSALHTWVRQGVQGGHLRLPGRYPYSEARVDAYTLVSTLVADLKGGDSDGFEGVTLDAVWAVFLPDARTPRHGAVRMGRPQYL